MKASSQPKRQGRKTPKRTQKTSKSTKSFTPVKNYYKILTFVFGIGFFSLAILTIVFLLPKLPTHEEEKRLEAFGTLADQYVHQFDITGEVDENGDYHGPIDTRVAFMTGIGLSRDDDLYIDYIVENYHDHVPESYQKIRAHFQCNDSHIAFLGYHACGIANHNEDEIPASEELKSVVIKWSKAITDAVDRSNATEDEAEKAKIHEETNGLTDEYFKIYKEELLKVGYPESYFKR